MALINKYSGKPLDPEWIKKEFIIASTPTQENINSIKTKQAEIERSYVNIPVTVLDDKYKMDPSIEKKYNVDNGKSIILHQEPDWNNEIQLLLKDYKKHKYSQGTNADEYFNRFQLKYIDKHSLNPLYEIQIYTELLNQLRNNIADKYEKIHKGTPYFFLGFNSLLIKNFEDAVYYLDLAIAEDIKNYGSPAALTSGAASFFLLNSKFNAPFKKYYYSTLEEIINHELNRFNSNKRDKLEITDFKKFVSQMILGEKSSIITTLYTFILKKESIMNMLTLRTLNKTSIEPMVSHLFKGALLFESLLKYYHLPSLSKNYPIRAINNIGGILDKKEIYTLYQYHFVNCRSNSLTDIFNYANQHDKQSIETAFHVTCRIRNLVVHNLNLPGRFNPIDYENIFEIILNAIFFVIKDNK